LSRTICRFIDLSGCATVWLTGYQAFRLLSYLAVWLFIFPAVSAVYLSVCPSVQLSGWLSVCLSVQLVCLPNDCEQELNGGFDFDFFFEMAISKSKSD
jgi:hypothetical protein